ncbi:hypothetical protein K2173_019700 [Erythroxylum novogranatense]|uniref:Uncharacterized protein n=1 Tax=Erythroxylum novogranatense TaxID=1862640 RepID=A0AAV8SMT2_9ROSI|nr:hypothetical protein K2173_019700 [Erythroxylum novogranatense]
MATALSHLSSFFTKPHHSGSAADSAAKGREKSDHSRRRDHTAVVNRSPVEGAYTEGLVNTKLTQQQPTQWAPTFTTTGATTGPIEALHALTRVINTTSAIYSWSATHLPSTTPN